MKVNNINGTGDNACKCGSWLSHWKNHSWQALADYCAEKNCINRPTIGAHVQKDDVADANWYIIPFCDLHNRVTGKSLEIIDSTKLVPANVQETCGK